MNIVNSGSIAITDTYEIEGDLTKSNTSSLQMIIYKVAEAS